MATTTDPNFLSIMHESLGARLRRQRERKGVSLKTIAQQTKIKQSLLDGLERDDLTHWPVGIFRKAYVRDYAVAIGVDPDAVIREFVEAYPAPIELPDPPPPAPSLLRTLLDSALGSLRPPAPRPAIAADTAPAAALPPAASGPRASAAALRASDTAPRVVEPGPRPVEAALRPPAPALRTPDSDPSPPDLLAAARICTELGRVEHGRQVPPLLREAAGILDAKGVIVWVWDALSQELRPAVALGYPAKMVSQLRGLKRDADNATADAFRSAEVRSLSGALVVPLLTPAACAGVLAIELTHRGQPAPTVMAIATILAAMLAQLVGTTADDTQPV